MSCFKKQVRRGIFMFILAAGNLPVAYGMEKQVEENPFITAIEKNDLAAVKAALQIEKNLKNINKPAGMRRLTPLQSAVGNDNKAIVELLIDEGHAKIDAQGVGGDTALHTAARGNKLEMSKLLLDKETDVKNNQGDTPMHNAAEDGYVDFVELLKARGANISEKNALGKTPLFRAVQEGHANVVQHLIKDDMDMDIQDTDGNTMLHEATKWASALVPILLKSRKIDINKINKAGETPLDIAIHSHKEEAAKALLANGAKRAAELT